MADQSGYPASPIPTLVGRDREQAALRAALAAALAGRGSLVLIGGEAGIGKTTLAEALLAEAVEQGGLVLVGRCYDLSETPPYGPWREALARALQGDPPAPVPNLSGGAGAASQAALLAQARDYLAALATRRPLVLLLEDLHWADPASLDLLRVVGRGLAEVPLLLLITYRADELTRRHPLYALLPLLEREARSARLDLRPLGEAALGTLVERYALLPGDAARLVAWLRSRAEGNAFFTAQLLRALEDAGVLRPEASGWALGDLAAVGLPTPLRQVLDARLARLGEAHLRLLTLAAVVGQAVPLATWAAVAETEEDELLDAIDAAAAAHLVAVAPDGGTVRFAHALIREALYAGLVATRRRLVHRRVAEVLVATPDPDPDAVADHFQRAGDPRAADWLIAAGGRAQRGYAWLSAAERLETALALLEAGGAATRGRAWLLLRLGILRRFLSDPRRALAYFDSAEQVADRDDPLFAGHLACHRGVVRCFTGDVRRGVAEQAAGVAALVGLPAPDRATADLLRRLGMSLDTAEYRSTLALWLASTGAYARAREAAEGVIAGLPSARGDDDAVRDAWDGDAAADAFFTLGYVHAFLGQAAAAQGAFAAATARLRERGHQAAVVFVLGAALPLVALAYHADRPAERRNLALAIDRAVELSRGVMDDDGWRVAALPALQLDGRWAEIQERARVVADRGYGHPAWRVASSVLGPLARARGERAAAWDLVRAWLSDGPATQPGDCQFDRAIEFHRLAAALALDDDAPAVARAWLEAHDRWLAWSGAVLGRAEGQLGWAAYHRMAGNLAQARAQAERALAHATDPRQPLALLAAHRFLGELDTADGRHAEAGAHLAQALALAAACAAPYERALTLLALAEVRAAEGQGNAATAALAEARVILATLGAAPALAETLGERPTVPPPPLPRDTFSFGLTAREVDVLRLLAEGLPDAAIAARLFVSHNTVKFHLKAIYGKLRVNTRAAATRLALDHGLA